MTESIRINPAAGWPERISATKWAATAMIASAVLGGVIGALTSTVYPELADRTSGVFNVSGAVLTVAHVLTFVAVVALIGTRAAGTGWLARVAYVVTLVGLATQAVAEGLLRFNFGAGTTLFGIASPAMALGFVVLGIAVIRAHAWTGWRRFTPLLCGVYVPVVLIPAFIAAGGVSFPAITAWQLCFVLLGAAMWAGPTNHQ